MTAQEEITEIAPQKGPQSEFAACEADIAIYGGAAGGGKTWGLLFDPLRHMEKSPDFGGVIFRRTSVQIRAEGGLWDESIKLYGPLGAEPAESKLTWKFPHPTRFGEYGMTMSFANLELDESYLNYQGSQMPYIAFDELTHFTEQQFFYMFSRNRSTTGVKARIRASCNPDPDSFVRKLIDWWIGKDGYPIKERAGKLRYFIRVNDEMLWADSREEIHQKYGSGPEIQPTSLTFIPSKLDDNRKLLEMDKTYESRLLALGRVDRMRLREGNWNVRANAGNFFRREWFPILDTVPGAWIQQCRYWDRAATKPSETSKDPDWTRGLKMYKYPNGTYLVVDLKSIRDTPGEVEKFIKAVASHDSVACTIYGEQEPGAAGVADIQAFVKMLQGYDARITKPAVKKSIRAKPVSAQAEAGNIFILRGDWNEAFFQEVENFSENDEEYAHDDIVDTLSGAFNEMSGGLSSFDVSP